MSLFTKYISFKSSQKHSQILDMHLPTFCSTRNPFVWPNKRFPKSPRRPPQKGPTANLFAAALVGKLNQRMHFKQNNSSDRQQLIELMDAGRRKDKKNIEGRSKTKTKDNKDSVCQ